MVDETPAPDQNRALLDVVSSIMAQSSVPALFRDLTEKLSRYVYFDRMALLRLDESSETVAVSEVYSTTPVGASVPLIFPLHVSPAGKAIAEQRPVFIPDVDMEPGYPRVMALLCGERLATICYFPLTGPTRKIGALACASSRKMQWSEADLALLQRAVGLVAVAIDNILSREEAERERDGLRLLLEVNNALVAVRGLRDLFADISKRLQPYAPHDALSWTSWDSDRQQLRVRFVLEEPGSDRGMMDMVVPLVNTPSGDTFRTGKPRVYGDSELARVAPPIGDLIRINAVRSLCCFPLETSRGKFGTITFTNRQSGVFTPDRMATLGRLIPQISLVIESAMAFDREQLLIRRLKEEKLYLEDELREAISSDEILGKSPAVRRILEQIETVASTGATVLIHGETGCGKELVARALHERSSRAKGTFVKLNCAAIPTGLLESELFGHEKGAFTGAIAQKIGRFEIAHQGTLFLDEIGEIALDLQPKLLRVLQEKEFERLGGTRTIRSDARLVAATNRDLEAMVEAGKFRADLYYRLNVFPIEVPPLRQRKEDIPLLAMHFTNEFARRFGRRIESVPAESLHELVEYPWPGNIRELQNFIERSVILTQGPTLRVPIHELKKRVPDSAPPAARTVAPAPASGTTLEEVERGAILSAIRECKGTIGGPAGAAARLGMKRTTLISKMEKLGIDKTTIRAGPPAR